MFHCGTNLAKTAKRKTTPTATAKAEGYVHAGEAMVARPVIAARSNATQAITFELCEMPSSAANLPDAIAPYRWEVLDRERRCACRRRAVTSAGRDAPLQTPH
jgi:hypothetical protein